MQDLMQFIINHWLLCGLLVLLVILLFVEEMRSKGLMGQLSVQDVVQWMNRQGAVVIDIRDRQAFQQGHITGAINIPRQDLLKDFNKLNKYKTRPLIIVCATGQTAGTIVMQLKKQQFEQVNALAGGITAWKTAQLPLVKK